MAHPNLSPSFPTALRAPLQGPSSASYDNHAKAAPLRPLRLATQLSSTSSNNQHSYQHFSALRSTHEAPPKDMLPPVCHGSDDCGFVASGYDCEECQQGCEDGSCTVEFTSQCTDQCVVVACNDPHHEAEECGQLPDGQECGKQCTAELDCTVFEEFVSTLSQLFSNRVCGCHLS